jgi:membrane protein YdbS with pleckstrin-like domain
LLTVLKGIIVIFLDLGIKARIWLIILPFIGVIIDLASVWLKLFVHPAFFWLHIPGGSLFGVVFIVDAVLILQQMWFYKHRNLLKNEKLFLREP